MQCECGLCDFTSSREGTVNLYPSIETAQQSRQKGEAASLPRLDSSKPIENSWYGQRSIRWSHGVKVGRKGEVNMLKRSVVCLTWNTKQPQSSSRTPMGSWVRNKGKEGGEDIKDAPHHVDFEGVAQNESPVPCLMILERLRVSTPCDNMQAVVLSRMRGRAVMLKTPARERLCRRPSNGACRKRSREGHTSVVKKRSRAQ